MDHLAFICDAISKKSGQPFKLTNKSSLSGGCINQCFQLEGHNSSSFRLKQNSKSFLPFFEAEALPLEEIKNTDSVRVPAVITFGVTDDSSFLVLEFIPEGISNHKGQKELGKQLANLHKIQKSFLGGSVIIVLERPPNPIHRRKIGFHFTGIHGCFINLI